MDDELSRLANIVKKLYADRGLANYKIAMSRTLGQFRIPDKFSTVYGHEKLEHLLKKATQYVFVNKELQEKQKGVEELSRLETIIKQNIEHLKSNGQDVTEKEKELEVISKKLFNAKHEEYDDETKRFRKSAYNILKILCERNDEGYSTRKAQKLYDLINQVMGVAKSDPKPHLEKPKEWRSEPKTRGTREHREPRKETNRVSDRVTGLSRDTRQPRYIQPRSFVPKHLKSSEGFHETREFRESRETREKVGSSVVKKVEKSELTITEDNFPSLGGGSKTVISGAWKTSLSKEVLMAPPKLPVKDTPDEKVDDLSEEYYEDGDEFRQDFYEDYSDEYCSEHDDGDNIEYAESYDELDDETNKEKSDVLISKY